MRCPRCGNENPETNRFCGMCGATLLPAAVGASQGAATSSGALPSPASPPPAPKSTSASRTVERVPEAEPVISGPSFLGLGQPTLDRPAASAAPRRGSLSIDPNSAPSSRNLDYLLDDEPSHGGAGKYFLMFVALLLAIGLGYLRWKNHGFGWLTDGAKKPAITQPSETPDSSASTPPGGNANSSAAPAASDPGTAPAPAPDSAATPANPAANPATPAATPSAPATADTADSKSAASPAATPADAPQPSPAKDDSTSAADKAPTKSVKPKPAPAASSAKPAPATRASADTVSEAQRYLYGKGVRQDCDRGLRLLKPAADHANPKAMIELGALYSAGLCTPRDLPTAYRWFAMALRKEPDNQSVQTDLQKLWGEMTQPERQLAIKLSQ